MTFINRRQALQCLSAGALTLAMPRIGPAQQDRKPNILFILSDDQHFRTLRCTGNQDIFTPHLDRLASEGTLFSHCYVSNPICTPSRACVLTGQYGFQNGVTFFGHKINEDSPRLPRILSEAGYHTHFTGKWHNDQRPVHHGFDTMRNVFLGGMNNYDSIPVIQDREDKKQEVQRNPTELFTQSSLEFLQSEHEKPFASFLWYTTPHDPRTPPPEYGALYPADRVSLPENFMPEPPYDPGTLDIRDEKLMERPLDPEKTREQIGQYYGMITHMDDQIGLLLKALEQNGLMDNTYIVFAGDNGLTLGSHGLLGKQTLHEEGIRVPLIIRGPGVRQGAVCEELVDLMDLMPTFCEMAGAPVSHDVQGQSVLGLAGGTSNQGREEIFCHYDDMFRMIRRGNYKYIYHLKSNKRELFDLREDPYEFKNLAESSKHEKIVLELHHRLHEWQKQVHDPHRVPEA